MSIFSKAEAIAEGIEHSASALLIKIFGQDALTKVEGDIKVIFQEDVIVIFQDAITAADSLTVGDSGTAATGTQKRDAAFAQIVKDLESKGINLGESVVDLGIELVVGLLKAKTPAAPAETAA